MFHPFATLLTLGTVVLATGSSCTYPAKPASDSIGEAIDDLRWSHEELRRAGRPGAGR